MTKSALFFTMVLLMALPVSADDIGLITIKNEYQAQVVRAIVDHALAMVEDRFLALIDDNRAASLTRAGIEYEIVFADADPVSTFLIYPPRKKAQRPALPPGQIEIGMGLRISRASDLAYGAGEGKMARLADLRVPIRLAPEPIAGILSFFDEFPSDSLADLVLQDSVYFFDTRLEDFRTRYVNSDSIDAARDWMVQKFLDWGYTDVTTPSFNYEGGWHYNVMAVKPGWAEPDKVIVVGGHYDSITYGITPGPMVYAPGADDNASGTTVVLELARILADIPLRKTVIFIAFSAEEIGLAGSYEAAHTFYEDETDLEVMYNYDMVAHDPEDARQIDLSAGRNTVYRYVVQAAAERVTTLSSMLTAMGSSSDHYPFYVYGFNVVDAIETDFNSDGWHTDLDISSRLNFEYFTDVVRMAAANLGVVANSAHPTMIEALIDRGDGQSVEIFWSDCDPTYTYTVRYGTVPGVHPNAVPVSPGACSWVVDGLTEGLTYYFTVVGEVADAYPPVWTEEESIVSYVVPRQPQNPWAEAGLFQIHVDWDDNMEGDLSHYRVYRDDGTGQVLYQDNVTESELLDTDVEGLVVYTYRVAAVDFDLNESVLSDAVSAMPYTFDQGILLVDETADDFYLPPQAEQEAFFDSIFAEIPYGLDLVAGAIDTLPRQTAGPYSSIFWLDDDIGHKDIAYNENNINWYCGYPTSTLIAGWQTINRWTPSPLDTDHLLYQQFGLSGYTQNDVNDFVGAVGQNGWPSLTTDTDNLWGGKLPFIPALQPLPGAEVIYTYDSFSDDPNFEGEPCGLLYETANGKRIILAFPVYFLTPSSSEAVIARAAEEFGEYASYVFGDADGSGVLDILDLEYLINYFYMSGPPPVNMNASDADGSCQLDVLDLDYLVGYLYLGGPAPVAGCIN
ncbi:MAG: M20/M25/M40 family metallo-hydrolase [Candidatus Zixiibacteriota bacterium]|nr:MAG: M20/M25/M40 family metallo-hydrolase [candidate division Zixibacteria bacterium]